MTMTSVFETSINKTVFLNGKRCRSYFNYSEEIITQPESNCYNHYKDQCLKKKKTSPRRRAYHALQMSQR